jgi:hypothetical protein
MYGDAAYRNELVLWDSLVHRRMRFALFGVCEQVSRRECRVFLL